MGHFLMAGKCSRIVKYYNGALLNGADLHVGNEKSDRSFSDRSFFMDVRTACPCQIASFFPGFGGPDRSFRPDVPSNAVLVSAPDANCFWKIMVAGCGWAVPD